MKTLKKFFKILTVSILLVSMTVTSVFAGTGIDLSAGKIIGKNGDYYFKIPVSWDGYIYASRDKTDNYDYFDKIDFYYKHKDVGNKDLLFLSLYVYYKENYGKHGYTNQTKILETEKYVFTTSAYMSNPYSSVNDRIIFSRFLIELGTPNFISNKIYVSAQQNDVVQSGTLTVNGRTSSIKPIVSKNVIYLPLRETADKLGYSTKWVPSTKTVVLTKGSKTASIQTTKSNVINKKGTIYVPISFFMQTLKCSVDVDSRNNIRIKG